MLEYDRSTTIRITSPTVHNTDNSQNYSVKLAFFEEIITEEWGYQDIRCPEPPTNRGYTVYVSIIFFSVLKIPFTNLCESFPKLNAICFAIWLRGIACVK